ncbi:MAG: hypothetical protein ACXVAO_04470 [Vulcanimicrobiaceae bacterium]
MIGLAPLALAAVLSPAQIFTLAQQRWETHVVPPFVEFAADVVHRDVSGRETHEHQQIVLRTSDHVCRAVTIDEGGAARVDSGRVCYGPAYSPLGFSTSSAYRNAAAPDPFLEAPLPSETSVPLRVIASVRAIASHYEVTLLGEETLSTARVYHLELQPLGDPHRYPLRALWIDESTHDVRKLTYAEWPQQWEAQIDYSFAPFGAASTWWITRIDARWLPTGSLRHSQQPFTSTLLLRDILFPASVPPAEFQSS